MQKPDLLHLSISNKAIVEDSPEASVVHRRMHEPDILGREAIPLLHALQVESLARGKDAISDSIAYKVPVYAPSVAAPEGSVILRRGLNSIAVASTRSILCDMKKRHPDSEASPSCSSW